MSEENKSHVGATERVLLNQGIERLKTQLDWCRDSANMAIVELAARAEQAEQRVAELESKVRDMEPTYLWGAKVMNEIVLPRGMQIRKSELPADALSRWLREGGSLRATLESLIKAVSPAIGKLKAVAYDTEMVNVLCWLKTCDVDAIRVAVQAAEKEIKG